MAVCRGASAQRKGQVFSPRKSRSIGGQSDFGDGQIIGLGHALAVADTVEPNKAAESQNNHKNEETKPFQDLEQHRTLLRWRILGGAACEPNSLNAKPRKRAKPRNTQRR